MTIWQPLLLWWWSRLCRQDSMQAESLSADPAGGMYRQLVEPPILPANRQAGEVQAKRKGSWRPAAYQKHGRTTVQPITAAGTLGAHWLFADQSPTDSTVCVYVVVMLCHTVILLWLCMSMWRYYTYYTTHLWLCMFCDDTICHESLTMYVYVTILCHKCLSVYVTILCHKSLTVCLCDDTMSQISAYVCDDTMSHISDCVCLCDDIMPHVSDCVCLCDDTMSQISVCYVTILCHTFPTVYVYVTILCHTSLTVYVLVTILEYHKSLYVMWRYYVTHRCMFMWRYYVTNLCMFMWRYYVTDLCMFMWRYYVTNLWLCTSLRRYSAYYKSLTVRVTNLWFYVYVTILCHTYVTMFMWRFYVTNLWLCMSLKCYVTNLWLYSSVQFSSRWYICTR